MMRRLFCRLGISLLLLAGALETTAQVIKIETTPGRRMANEGTWLFRAGDSTGWASPAYTDRHWARINPGVDLDDNPTLWKTGRGWFRKTLRFRRLHGKDMTISIRQFGQSEVYFDGRRIAVLKPPQYDSGGSQRIVAFLPMRIEDTNRHTLAVRYAFRRDPVIGAMIDKEPFQLEYGKSDQAAIDLLDDQRSSAGMGYLLTGIFSVLSLLHFLFYRANPSKHVNRVLAGTMLAFALTFLTAEADTITGTLTLDSLRGALGRIFVNTAFGLLLLSVYTYLGRRPGWPFWGIVVSLAAEALYSVFIGQVSDDLFWIPFMLVLVEYIRVSWLAKRRNPDPDARLPWNSLKVTLWSLLAILLTVIGIAAYVAILRTKDGLDWTQIPLALLAFVALFSIPLGLSLSLVRDYARTYLSLQQKFDEVEQLSAQTLAQEQEKQQLLARQNEMLEHQVADRTAELQQSLDHLRTTQTQLIQAEKMASLGELTAGIAHEIQNPLNFVNNFSEVSAELVDELQEEQMKGGQRDSELETELLGDLKQNLQKITQHGNRASSIVKGMLEHSRKSTGQKEPTDLNALADEYLRLAYHGLRAKDKTFNCELATHFDPAMKPVAVVQQDISRVLLNLYTNAFYAVADRAKNQQAGTPDRSKDLTARPTGGPAYRPTITVITRMIPHHVPEGDTSSARPIGLELRVRDNGTGIPESVKAKIFQPFFTTKPTGEGTGLGLSLSYDIITKGHGGTLTVVSKEGEGTEFIITLPCKTL